MAKDTSFNSVLSSLTSEQRMRLASGEDPREVLGVPAPAEPVTPAPVAPVVTPPEPAAPTLETPAPEETPAEPETPAPEEPTTPEPEDKTPDRFRFKSEEDRTVALLAKTLGVSLVEAARRYEGMKKPVGQSAPAEVPEVDDAPPAYVPPPEIARLDADAATLDATIKTLTEQRAKALEEFDNQKIIELGDKITEARMEKSRLENRRDTLIMTHESAHQSAYKRTAEESRDAVYAKYPDLKNTDGVNRLAFDAYVARVQADPKRSKILENPRWPEKLAEEFASKVGLKPTGAATPPPAPPAKPKPTVKPTTVPVPGAKLINGADGSHPSPSSPQLTEQSALTSLGTLSAKQRLELVDKY